MNSPQSEQPKSAGQYLIAAMWIGLMTAFAEVAGLKLSAFLQHKMIFLTPDIVWMIPLANLILFLLVGVLILALARLWPRRIGWKTLISVCIALGAILVALRGPRIHPAALLLLAAGIGIQAARFLARYVTAVQRLMARTLPILIAVVLIVAVALPVISSMRERRRLAALPAAASGTPNILLLVLDTVRDKNLSLSGYERPTTPALERWAARGVRFSNALSTAPWTLPSHATMMTGRLPRELSAGWLTPLDNTYPMLAEQLAARGYETAGFVANKLYCSRETGLARGFTHYEDYDPLSIGEMVRSTSLGSVAMDQRQFDLLRGTVQGMGRVNGDEINGRVMRWLEQRDPGRPFFAFLNYLDAHRPYLVPEPYRTRFLPQGGENHLRRVLDDTPPKDWTPETVAAALGAYDGAIAYLDAKIDELLTSLEQRGVLQNTLVIITADHGEEFGEHGVYLHGHTLYRPSVDVPLLILGPGGFPAGTTITTPVSLRDLAATIMSAVDTAAPLPGRSLARFWAIPSDTVPDPSYSTLEFSPRLPAYAPIAKGSMSSVVYHGLRLIREGDGNEELYDLFNDYDERHNLVSAANTNAELSRLLTELRGLLPPVGKNRKVARFSP